jgi:putative ATP-dependent endonuclease of OLD family
MYISSVTLKGFRCFGATERTKVELEPGMNAFIGANGTGKTALLQALLRLFGSTQSERRIRPEDFYVRPDEKIEDVSQRKLWVEARLEFPELLNGESPEVAPFLRNTVIRSDEPPFIRARLQADWYRDGTIDGSIEEQIEWIRSGEENVEEIDDDQITRMKPYERSQIRVEYIPAQRDVASQIRRKSGSVVSELIRAVQWTEDTEDQVSDATDQMRKAVGEEPAIEQINNRLQAEWGALHDGTYDQNPTLHVVEEDFRDLVRNMTVSFEPTATGKAHSAEALSDGLRSLFHLSMLLSHHNLLMSLPLSTQESGSGTTEEVSGTAAEPPPDSEKISDGNPSGDDSEESDQNDSTDSSEQLVFDKEELEIPQHVTFALEEPENHLAPYYLSRITEQLRDLSGSSRVQSVLTSHSASTLERISPKEVRYFRLESTEDHRTAAIQQICLPDEENSEISDTNVKYIREAVRAHPELYFARFIVFAEGDSEEVVLPHLAEALGYTFDPSFVAVVPLGGRHVNHFWRLANDLQIPHATLLDLDMGRRDAGWKRIEYVLDQLKELPGTTPLSGELDDVELGDPYKDGVNSPHNRFQQPTWNLREWIEYLERYYGVFFSNPLDLDWSMMRAFPEAYRDSAGSPRSFDDSAVEDARKSVLGQSSQERYDDAVRAGWYEGTAEKESFIWYRYLFQTKSKPTTHLRALVSLDDDQLQTRMPGVLRRLIEHINTQLRRQDN